MAEKIIFVEGNRIHVDPKFGERGTFIRDASTNIARINYHAIVRVCLLIQIKRTEINFDFVKANFLIRFINTNYRICCE
jgi:hypothetical protein